MFDTIVAAGQGVIVDKLPAGVDFADMMQKMPPHVVGTYTYISLLRLGGRSS